MSNGHDNTNSGILSRNERREKDTHPEFTGSLNVEGTEYWLNAWVRERKDGSGRFFSLSLKRKDTPRPRPAPEEQPAHKLIDDEIPF